MTKSVSPKIPRVNCFTIPTGLKNEPFDLHLGRQLRVERTIIQKDEKNYLTNWTKLNSSVAPEQIPNDMGRSAMGQATDHIVMVPKTKAFFRS